MKDFLEEVNNGLEGKNEGIRGGLPRLDQFVCNIQKARYEVVGAMQKTGKTAFIDYRYVISPYMENKYRPINWIYFSYEIDRLAKMAKFCAYFMRIKHGIQCSANYILSRGENKLDPKHLSLVEDIYKNELSDLFGVYDQYGRCTRRGRIDFIEEKDNPTGIYKYLMRYAEQNGQFIYEPYMVMDDNGRKVEKQRIIGYKENNPNLYTIIILDHVGLMRKENGYDKKANIDKMSEYFVFFRNICRFTPIVVSQFNRGLGKIDRLKFSGEDLQPTMEDFKDTGNMGEDASLVLGLFNPTLFPHLESHLGYDLTKLGKRYRSLHILASRDTETGVNLSMAMDGETGFFEELPKLEEFEGNPFLYSKYE